VILRLSTKSHIHIIKIGRLVSDILDDDKIIFFFLSIFSDPSDTQKAILKILRLLTKSHIHIIKVGRLVSDILDEFVFTSSA